jgi:hypothetical protein
MIGGGVGRGGGGGGIIPEPTLTPPKGVSMRVGFGGGVTGGELPSPCEGAAAATGIGEPHFKQNFAVAVFSDWQLRQITPMAVQLSSMTFCRRLFVSFLTLITIITNPC